MLNGYKKSLQLASVVEALKILGGRKMSREELLEGKINCECGAKVIPVQSTTGLIGICECCRRKYTGDGEPDFSEDGKSIYCWKINRNNIIEIFL